MPDIVTAIQIKLVKNYNVDGYIFNDRINNGYDGREPYHCILKSYEQTETICNKIGGVWDTDLERCSIGVPQNSGDCSSAGGTWENDRCNLLLIETEIECTDIGGTWVKNNFDLGKDKYICTSIPEITEELDCTNKGGVWADDICSINTPTDEPTCTLVNGSWVKNNF